MPSFSPMSRLYILTLCIRVSSSFSFFANSLMSSMYIKWLTFSCELLSLYLAVHFLRMWLSGIMTIMNSKGDRASPWKIPLWIFASVNLLPPAVKSTLQVFIVLSMKLMTSSDILYILRLFTIQLCGTISYAFLLSIQAIARFFRLVLLSFKMCWVKPDGKIYYLLIRVFLISVNWWSFTGVWTTASLLRSPELFSVFWPFSIM